MIRAALPLALLLAAQPALAQDRARERGQATLKDTVHGAALGWEGDGDVMRVVEAFIEAVANVAFQNRGAIGAEELERQFEEDLLPELDRQGVRPPFTGEILALVEARLESIRSGFEAVDGFEAELKRAVLGGGGVDEDARVELLYRLVHFARSAAPALRSQVLAEAERAASALPRAETEEPDLSAYLAPVIEKRVGEWLDESSLGRDQRTDVIASLGHLVEALDSLFGIVPRKSG